MRRNETDYALKFTAMGARIYVPTLGRFTSLDPIKGGTQNDYVYPVDPVNGSDFSGTFAFFSTSSFFNVGGWSAFFAKPATYIPRIGPVERLLSLQ